MISLELPAIHEGSDNQCQSATDILAYSRGKSDAHPAPAAALEH